VEKLKNTYQIEFEISFRKRKHISTLSKHRKILVWENVRRNKYMNPLNIKLYISFYDTLVTKIYLYNILFFF
jgi:hypothetical protein